MSRTRNKSKGPGWEFWGRRPFKGGTSNSRVNKNRTVRIERRLAAQQTQKEAKP